MAIKKDIEKFDWNNGWIKVEATLNGSEEYTCTFDFNTVNEAIRFRGEHGTVPSLKSYLEMLREVRLFVAQRCHWSNGYIRRLRRIEHDDGQEHGQKFWLPHAMLVVTEEAGDCLWVENEDIPLRLSPPGKSARFLETRAAYDMLMWYVAAEVAPSVCVVDSKAPSDCLKDVAPHSYKVPKDTGWSIAIKSAE